MPKQELVQSEQQAVRAAKRIGFPVVTKPYNGNHGRGISIRLTTEEEVAQGYLVAREHSRSVIVETFLEGDDHRLLVVNGELVAATRRTPGHVVGDGRQNIIELDRACESRPCAAAWGMKRCSPGWSSMHRRKRCSSARG